MLGDNGIIVVTGADGRIGDAVMRRIAGPWSPWSSVGTWYMWRSLDNVTF